MDLFIDRLRCVRCANIPPSITASFSSENLLVQDGHFYLPTRIVEGVQHYRKLTSLFDPDMQQHTAAISDVWYYKENGIFVEGEGNDELEDED